MTCCRQSTCSSCLFVNWAAVRMTVVNICLLCWNDVDALHLCEQNLWHRLFKRFFSLVPSATFNEETPDVHTIFWSFIEVGCCLIWNDLEVIVKKIDSYDVLSGIVLLCTSEEWLSEEETRDPEVRWSSIIDPWLHELQSLKEIEDPWSQWLKGWVSSCMPNLWNCVGDETCANFF